LAKLGRICHQRLGFGAQLLGPRDQFLGDSAQSRLVPEESVLLEELAIHSFYFAGPGKESAKIGQLTNWRFSKEF